MEWRPIETAPRDETWVFIYAHYLGEPKAILAFWSEDGGWYESEAASNDVGFSPTHWHPFEAPQAG